MAGYIGSKTSVTQVDGYNRTEADDEFVNDPNSVITVSGSNVGIGTSSPSRLLTLSGTASPYIALASNTTGGSPAIFFGDSEDDNEGRITYSNSQDYMSFSTATAERMRIDSSGNLLVGTTDTNPVDNSDGSAGLVYNRSNGQLLISGGSNRQPLYVNRQGTDGDMAVFRKDGSTVGSIGSTPGGGIFLRSMESSTVTNNGALVTIKDASDGARLILGGVSSYGFIGDQSGAGSGIAFVSTSVRPFSTDSMDYQDNSYDMGTASARWDDVYATNGTIQTSDRNEKQDIEALSDAEQRVAVACKGLLRKFRWIDAVAEKGDDARIHFGIIAQDLQDAFAAEGLDAGRYAMFISSTWWETQTEVPAVEAVEAAEATYDEDGNELTAAVEAVEAKEAYTRTDTYETLEEAPEGATERTRLGVRYPELLAFIIGAM